MTVRKLYEKLNEMIPPSLSCEWDNDGLMVEPAPDREVKKALVALDANMAAIDRAVKIGADVLITHHPMIFRELKNLSYTSFQTPKIIKCIENKIAVMSFHTRLDALEGGVNDALVKKLGIKDAVPLCDMARVGYIEPPMPLGGFAAFVKDTLGCDGLRYVGGNTVHKIAVLGGDGKDLIDSVVAVGCDTYVTGNTSYNIMIDTADMGINCIEAGHFFTEDPVCDVLCDMLDKLGVETEKFVSNTVKGM